MILKFRDPSVRLEVGTMADDAIASAIYNEIGVREMGRRVGKSRTTISLFASGKLALSLPVVLRIAEECGLEESVWLATLYERMEAAERIGWTFRPEDRVKPEVFHA